MVLIMESDDEYRSIDEDGIITIKKAGLYEISFVKDPLHPSWTVQLVQRDASLMLTEFATESQEIDDLYGFTAWKKANDAYFSKIFKSPYDIQGSPFRKQSITEVKNELHKLLAIVFTNPDDHKIEFEGRWTIDDSDRS